MTEVPSSVRGLDPPSYLPTRVGTLVLMVAGILGAKYHRALSHRDLVVGSCSGTLCMAFLSICSRGSVGSMMMMMNSSSDGTCACRGMQFENSISLQISEIAFVLHQFHKRCP